MQPLKIFVLVLILANFMFAVDYTMGPYSEGQSFTIEGNSVQIKTLYARGYYNPQLSRCVLDSGASYVDLITPGGAVGSIHNGEFTEFNVAEGSTGKNVLVRVTVNSITATVSQQGSFPIVTCPTSNKQVTFTVTVPTSTNYCTDPDGTESQGGVLRKTTISEVGSISSSKAGNNINLAATTASPATDTCYNNGEVASGGKIRERFCSVADGNTIRSNTIDCPANYQCNDGACILPQIQFTCNDPDGTNKNSVGTITVRKYVNGALDSETVEADSCIDQANVREKTCSADNSQIVNTPTACGAGSTCNAGACSVQQTEEFCTGTQEGSLDPVIVGEVTSGTRVAGGGNIVTSETKTDECATGDSVREFFCRNNRQDSTVNVCQTGTTCQSGACIQIGNTPFCTDSDNGDNKDTKGTIRYGIRDQSGNNIQLTTFDDECIDDSSLTEYYCDGASKVQYHANCPSGKSCVDGACRIATAVDDDGSQICQDSDNQDIYTKGENIARNAAGQLETKDDTCVSERTVTEYYCTSGNERRTQNKDCPANYICTDGACKRTNILQTTKTLEINMKAGWNLFSIPLQSTAITSTCEGFDQTNKIWNYDGVDKVWLHPAKLAPGEGYWFRAKQTCKITVTGTSYVIDDIKKLKLNKGWNQIGAVETPQDLNNLLSRCSINHGPWEYNTLAGVYEKATAMVPGKGYFVKITQDCNLGG